MDARAGSLWHKRAGASNSSDLFLDIEVDQSDVRTFPSSPVAVGGREGVGVEGGGGVLVGHAVAGVAVAEEGLVVVLGQLGQAGDHLLHRQLGGLTGPPPPGAHQPRLL